MSDPFQDIDVAGPQFATYVADVMDRRQNDPIMERLPSALLIAEAETRGKSRPNLTFAQADGASIPLPDHSARSVIMHTVLSHVSDPEPLIAEAFRLLEPGGCFIICDGDFSKGTLRSIANDPLGACSDEFIDSFVTHPHLIGQIQRLLPEAGFSVDSFEAASRLVTSEGMKPWVEMSTNAMVARGEIGQELADALLAEHARRVELGSIYGYQVFVTLIASRPK